MVVDNLKREMAALRHTHEQLSQQKKEYIRKVFAELESVKAQLQSELARESMAKEELHARCALLHQLRLKLQVQHAHDQEQIEELQRAVEERGQEAELGAMAYEEKRTRLLGHIQLFDDLKCELQETTEALRLEKLASQTIAQSYEEKLREAAREREEVENLMNGQRVQ